MKKEVPKAHAPAYLPGPAEVIARRDFIWACREYEWPEAMQDYVLRDGLPDLLNATAVTKIYGAAALPVLEGLRCR